MCSNKPFVNDGLLNFSRFLSIPDGCDRTVCLNDRNFNMQAYIASISIDFVGEVDPFKRLKMAVI